jgi:glycerol-3-phosphate dehydrogenase
VRHAGREVRAVRRADVVLRRAELGAGRDLSASALTTAQETMAEELGWDAARRTLELDHVARGLAIRRPTR